MIDDTSRNHNHTGHKRSMSNQSDEPLLGQIQQQEFEYPPDPKGDEITGAGRARTASNTQIVSNLVKSFMGSGILGLPFAFHSGGVIGTLVVMVIVGVCGMDCMLRLVRCKRELVSRGAVLPDGRPVTTFADVGRACYGRWMALAVDAALIFTQFGFAVVYMVYVADNLIGYFSQFDSDPHHGKMMILLAGFPVFVAMSWIRSPKHIGPISLTAIVCIFSSLVVLSVASFKQMASDVIPDSSFDVEWKVNWSGLSVAFGVAVYSFEGIGLVLPMETSARRPETYSKILARTMVVVIFYYNFFGLVPYLAFGDWTASVTTHNLACFATFIGSQFWHVVQNVVRICLVVAIAGTFPVQLFVAVDIMESHLLALSAVSQSSFATGTKNTILRNSFRTVVVFLAMVCALVIPHFGNLISLIGSLGSSMLAFVFPALFSLKLFPDRSRLTTCALCAYLVLGIVGGGLGTFQTITNLVHQPAKHDYCPTH